MQIGKTITLSIWLLTAFNLALSFGALWTFERMTPAVDTVLRRNVKNIDDCGMMILALCREDADSEMFYAVLDSVEAGAGDVDAAAVKRIRNAADKFFDGDSRQLEDTIAAVIDLEKIYRRSIAEKTEAIRHMQDAGAWTVVFTALVFFLLAIILFLRVKKNLLDPVNDIADVVAAHGRGDHFRRCRETGISQDMQNLCGSINGLLDRR